MSEEIKDIIEAEKEYNASQIQVLEGLEAVRKRPGMYIGSTSASGLHHLVYEIVDNAVDEALAGYCRHVVITINEGNTITVTDDGRGIPVDIQAQTGKPALEVVYTVLHAGGKFGGGGYKVSGGLHGVGASVVNALSEWLEVEVSKDGKIYQMKFSRGHITQEMRIIGTTDQHGTKVTFKPDPEMFDTLEYDYETLHTRMREQAFLNAGLHITIKDERIESADKPEKERMDSMCYEGGIREFVRWYNRHKTPLHEQVIYMSGTKGDDTAEVALQYNDSFASTIVSFANDIHTPEGGMHEEGFKRALTNVLNAYGVKKGYIKGDDKVSGDDVREGLTAIVSVKLTEAQFEGQTKAKLGNASMRTLVSNIVTLQLAEFLEVPKTNVYRSMQDINISLMQRVIFIRDKEVPDKKGKPNYKILHWLSSVEYKDGTLTYRLSDELKPYLIGLSEMFTLYSYDSIIKLPTNYSIRLFELLTSWVNIIIKGENTPAFPDISTDPDEIVLAIDYLRDFFDCNDKYKSAGDFVRNVIEVNLGFINQYTNLKVSFRKHKKGRSISHVIFKYENTWNKDPKAEEHNNQMLDTIRSIKNGEPAQFETDKEVITF